MQAYDTQVVFNKEFTAPENERIVMRRVVVLFAGYVRAHGEMGG